jgi:ABC-2 type transport system permease protein
VLKRSMVIARKEMSEAFRSKVIKYSFVGMGLMFGLVFPLLFGSIAALVGTSPSSGTGTSSLPVPPDFFPGFTSGQRAYLFFLYAFIAEILLMLPVILPIYISADSFAGEKERKTIQQLLSTPLTDSEILLGKILTSFIPTIITTYLCILSTTIVVNLSWYYAFGAFQLIFPNITALIQLVLVYPLLAFFGIITMVWVSTRANKVMEATQLGGVVVVPVLFVAFLPILLGLLTSLYFVLTVAALFAVLDYGLFRVASRKFTREAILRRI